MVIKEIPTFKAESTEETIRLFQDFVLRTAGWKISDSFSTIDVEELKNKYKIHKQVLDVPWNSELPEKRNDEDFIQTWIVTNRNDLNNKPLLIEKLVPQQGGSPESYRNLPHFALYELVPL